jgi:hypothetical protein
MIMRANVESILADVVESMLPTFSSKNLGLHMIFSFKYEDMGFNKDGNEIVRQPWAKRYAVELLFIRPNNYTKVLGRVVEDPSPKNFTPIHLMDKQIELKQFSDHDTGWRSGGFNTFFKTFIDAVKKYNEEHPEGPDLRDVLSEFHGFEVFNGKPKYVYIEYAHCKDKDDRWNSNYLVHVKRAIKPQEAVTLMPEIKEI